ncbi:hypothetical protein BT96DRAFT_940507 [Gymnopus androsaceus JB14]|uniref:DUF6534 domain-containing protein n=1 Tax=Gymnopus androsaceus JB14 TaxID=1447944 RepID=A0A6A4HLQ8_9AGAR|nr:hypothetical protein BT96DRAFT_940507 [Gymnopus androsaceus JB14]
MSSTFVIPHNIATKAGPPFPYDKKTFKGLVIFTLLIETAQSVMVMATLFRLFASGYGNTVQLNTVGLNWLTAPVLSSFVPAVTQHYFAWRIWRFSKSAVIPVIVILISLMQLAAGIAAGIKSEQVGKFSLLNEANFSRTSVWLIGTAVCDVIIAGSMTFYLRQAHTNSSIQSTRSIINKLVQLTVETGAICATFAIVEIITFLALGSTNYHLAPSGALSKLYSNSLLVHSLVNINFSETRGNVGPSEGGSGSAIEFAKISVAP